MHPKVTLLVADDRQYLYNLIIIILKIPVNSRTQCFQEHVRLHTDHSAWTKVFNLAPLKM